jgi:predicted signal transduction protein with EAL and GGDEF domain
VVLPPAITGHPAPQSGPVCPRACLAVGAHRRIAEQDLWLLAAGVAAFGAAALLAILLAAEAVVSRSAPLVWWLGGGLVVTLALTCSTCTYAARHLSPGRGRDPLTGLPDRGSFLAALDLALRRADSGAAAPDGGRIALILLDLEGFRALNDTFGHGAGDDVLRQTASHLRQWLATTGAAPDRPEVRPPGRPVHGARPVRCPRYGVAARLAGDEFALLIETTADTEALRRALQRLLASLAGVGVRPSGPACLSPDASAGLALYPEHARSSEDLLRCADRALRRAQCHGGVAVFDRRRDDVRAGEELDLLREVGRARQEDGPNLGYRPKMDFAGRTTGLEALVFRPADDSVDGPVDGSAVRSVDEDGWGPPGMYVSAAEAARLRWCPHTEILDAVVRHARHWWSQGLCLPVEIQVPAGEITEDGFASAVLDCLGRNGLPAHALELGVTGATGPDGWRSAAAALAEIRHAGVAISTSGPGMGAPSFHGLYELPADALRIDRRLVARIVSDEDDAAVVRCCVELAHLLGMDVVAAGVEDRATWGRLRDMGVDAVQGRFVSSVLPADDVADWLRERRAPTGAEPVAPAVPGPRSGMGRRTSMGAVTVAGV